MGTTRKTSLVDLGKLFFATMVVAGHTGFHTDNKYMSHYIYAFIVPFFFVCSGFFLGKKLPSLSEKKEYRSFLIQFGKRLFIPYIIWGIWYFFVEMAAMKVNDHLSLKAAFTDMLRNWIVSSPGGGLWYIQVILILTLILIISEKKWFRYSLFIICIVLSVVQRLIPSSGNDFIDLILNSHTFLWDGLYFFGGMALGENWNKKINRIIGFVMLMFSLVLKFIMLDSNVLYFSKIIQMIGALGLFILLYLTTAHYSMDFSIKMRRWSTIIYFTHMTVKYAVQMLFKVMHWPDSDFVFYISIAILFTYAVIVENYAKNTKLYKLLYLG